MLSDYRVIVDKSTVPVKTGEKVAESIKRYNRHGAKFDVVSNPEFLREGCAVSDLMHPDRIVIGAQSEHAIDLMKKVYEPFMAPILVTDINSAELIKHAANSFLALKISYINAISAICEASGADVEKVADGIGMDHRIGRDFLDAGIGYGGSCFPKDIAAFITISDRLGVPFELLKEVQRINQAQKNVSLKPFATRSGFCEKRRSPYGDSPSNRTRMTCVYLSPSIWWPIFCARAHRSPLTIQREWKKPAKSKPSQRRNSRYRRLKRWMAPKR